MKLNLIKKINFIINKTHLNEGFIYLYIALVMSSYDSQQSTISHLEKIFPFWVFLVLLNIKNFIDLSSKAETSN